MDAANGEFGAGVAGDGAPFEGMVSAGAATGGSDHGLDPTKEGGTGTSEPAGAPAAATAELAFVEEPFPPP